MGYVEAQLQSGYSKVCFNFEIITDTAILIYRQVVMEILRCIDPQGVQLRATHHLAMFIRVHRNNVCSTKKRED